MKVALQPFTLCSGGGLMVNIIKALSLFCWVVGGGFLIYSYIAGIHWSVVYPSGGNFTIAVWLINLALRIFALWMPMGLIMVHFKITDMIISIAFVVGTGIGLAFAVIAVILVWPYQGEGVLQKEYIELIEKKLVTGFPSSMKASSTLNSCCSWYGPTDFFESYEKTDERLANYEFMTGVAKCYGNIFKVEQQEAGLVFSNTNFNPNDTTKIEGCGPVYETAAANYGNFIVTSAAMVLVISLIYIVVFIVYFVQNRPSRVAPGNFLKPTESQTIPEPMSGVSNVSEGD